MSPTGREIEHKYLVTNDSYRAMAISVITINQGYLCRDKSCVVRVRIADAHAFITVKGRTVKDTRPEFEYEIPPADAKAMLDMCHTTIISKTRYIVPYEDYIWEVDEFHGPLQGLRLAEIELSESTHAYKLPPFVGREVTDNPDYYNSNLSLANGYPRQNI